jgi:diadenylate cyclase
VIGSSDLLKLLPDLYRGFAAIVDVVLVYIITYRVLVLLKRTHAFNLIKGILVMTSLFAVSYVMGLHTLNWILSKFTTVLLVLLVILFQPELRRFFERIGATGHVFSALVEDGQAKSTLAIQNILKAVEVMSKDKVGGIIVVERSTNLSEYVDSGIHLDCILSSDMLLSLFAQGTQTHDGAVIVRGGRIVAAGCLLPLTRSILQDRRLGTRHRAALGLAEITDAVAIVISEETGVISLAEDGDLTRFLTKEALESRLFNLVQDNLLKNASKKTSKRITLTNPLNIFRRGAS